MLTTHQLQVERRESHRAIKCMRSPHTSYRWRRRRVIESIKCMRSPHQLQVRGESHRAIKCMRSPHTSYRWERRVIERSSVCAHHTPATGGEGRESHRVNQVYALTTHQLQVERGRVIERSSVCAHHTPATGGERESHRVNQVYALTTHQLQVERRESHRAIKCMRSPHTSYRWRGERVIERSSVCAHHTPATGGEERES